MNKGRLASQTPDNPVLDEGEAARRVLLLGELHAELKASGVRCVLARNHRLVLKYSEAPLPPSGLTDPALHIFGPFGQQIATTDGTCYRLGSRQEFPVSDPAAAAAGICNAMQGVRS